jgi:uncharacterized protein (UPF0332 family)
MRFPWSAYLDIVELLLQVRVTNPPEWHTEAVQRIAVSRAYYAAFCTACSDARAHEGFSPTGTGRDHGDVIRHYQQRSRIHRHIAIILRRLRDVRNQGDYDDTIDEDLSLFAQNAVQDAHAVLDALIRLHP